MGPFLSRTATSRIAVPAVCAAAMVVATTNNAEAFQGAFRDFGPSSSSYSHSADQTRYARRRRQQDLASAAASASANTATRRSIVLPVLPESCLLRSFQRRRTALSCEPSMPDRGGVVDGDDDISSAPISVSWRYAGSRYRLMDLPSRAGSDAHVIYGALLKENCVESYHAYKNLDYSYSPATTTTTTTSEDNDDDDPVVVVAVAELGHSVTGHPGVVHGGVLALLIDDVLGYAYEALGDVPLAVTANLNINYLQAVPAGSALLIEARLQQREGRKLFWKVRVLDAAVASDKNGESAIYCEATCLFIIPRNVYSDNTTTISGSETTTN